MERVELDIYHLGFEDLMDDDTMLNGIYLNMHRNYYWSDDFSPYYYVAQAKAGFIAVTEVHEGRELLFPEIQYSYALLDFKDLHIGKKVKKLLKEKELELEISEELDVVYEKLKKHHKRSWFTKQYLEILKEASICCENFNVISVIIYDEDEPVAGEIGYIIGRVYTSLSGFSSKEKCYQNYGTAQLVLLSRYLERKGFAFLNLGQPYMDYKIALGAKVYERHTFLERWFDATQADVNISLL